MRKHPLASKALLAQERGINFAGTKMYWWLEQPLFADLKIKLMSDTCHKTARLYFYSYFNFCFKGEKFELFWVTTDLSQICTRGSFLFQNQTHAGC